MRSVEFIFWATKPGPEPIKTLGDSVYVWLAVILATLAIGKQIFDALKNRKVTQTQVEEALDKQPLVREQLELGNWGEAIKQLNNIINSQAEHIHRQDDRIKHLEDRNEALEAEAESWEQRHDELKGQYDELETKCDNLEAEVIRLTLLVNEG